MVTSVEAAPYGSAVVHVYGSGMRLLVGRGTDQMVQRLKTWSQQVKAGTFCVPDLEGGVDGVVVFGGLADTWRWCGPTRSSAMKVRTSS